MHSALLLYTLSFAFFHAVQAFEFTGPDASEKLDLTQPVNITWDANNGSLSEPKARALDLWFYALTSDDSGRLGWELDTDLPLSAGLYKWNPDTVVKSLKDKDVSISPDAVQAFEARLLDNSGSKLSTVESDKYAVEGFDFIRNSAGKGAQAGFYTAAIALSIAGLVLLR
ncbi:hypothetical protein DER46DRAFT_111578 [Fusarium sp. MPI-SDFR-AT-0072]|uniref:Uncharacterized protein n=1 Tax=Fusarium oxysporum f. sp. rapae TaxID=485398 RepID=A0A8J5NZR9_FUSOX|nr:hypothetical protein Forpe1208_v010708 [Fusarium oxysporum f. sp. rapae]KAH7143339.1 hypothetical protein DER46DRAFT_111578 [Fusarium sp. MPI-SDFR-AT-0072]